MIEKNTLFRWIFAIGCFGIAFSLSTKGYQKNDLSGVVFGAFIFVFGVAAIFTNVVEIGTRPMTAFIDSLFFPGGKLSKPTKNLKLPVYYEKKLRFDEALYEYKKVIRFYPDEVQAYEGAIRLLIKQFEDYPAAQKLFAKSRRRNLVLADEVSEMLLQR